MNCFVRHPDTVFSRRKYKIIYSIPRATATATVTRTTSARPNQATPTASVATTAPGGTGDSRRGTAAPGRRMSAATACRGSRPRNCWTGPRRTSVNQLHFRVETTSGFSRGWALIRIDVPDPDEASLSLPVLVLIAAAAVVVIVLIAVLIACACVKGGWWKSQTVRVPTVDDPGVATGSGRHSRYCGELAIGTYCTKIVPHPIENYPSLCRRPDASRTSATDILPRSTALQFPSR